MKLYYPIEVDLYKPFPLPVMDAQQNNVGRGAIVTLTANGAVIQPTDEVLTFWAKRPDGTISFLPASMSGSNVQIDFTNQMLSVPGNIEIEIRMGSQNGIEMTDISSPVFIVRVHPSNIDDSEVESQNEFTELQTAIGNLQTALLEVDELKETGLKGDQGKAATITVGTVTASEPGSTPTVNNSGTENAAVFDFVLPRGEQGPTGTGAEVVADAFDSEKTYVVGDYCIYNNVLYRFTSEKSAGVWDSSVVAATLVEAELKSLNSKIIISYGTSYSFERVGKQCILSLNGVTIRHLIDGLSLGEYAPKDAVQAPVYIKSSSNYVLFGRIIVSSDGISGEFVKSINSNEITTFTSDYLHYVFGQVVWFLD